MDTCSEQERILHTLDEMANRDPDGQDDWEETDEEIIWEAPAQLMLSEADVSPLKAKVRWLAVCTVHVFVT